MAVLATVREQIQAGDAEMTDMHCNIDVSTGQEEERTRERTMNMVREIHELFSIDIGEGRRLLLNATMDLIYGIAWHE